MSAKRITATVALCVAAAIPVTFPVPAPADAKQGHRAREPLYCTNYKIIDWGRTSQCMPERQRCEEWIPTSRKFDAYGHSDCRPQRAAWCFRSILHFGWFQTNLGCYTTRAHCEKVRAYREKNAISTLVSASCARVSAEDVRAQEALTMPIGWDDIGGHEGACYAALDKIKPAIAAIPQRPVKPAEQNNYCVHLNHHFRDDFQGGGLALSYLDDAMKACASLPDRAARRSLLASVLLWRDWQKSVEDMFCVGKRLECENGPNEYECGPHKYQCKSTWRRKCLAKIPWFGRLLKRPDVLIGEELLNRIAAVTGD